MPTFFKALLVTCCLTILSFSYADMSKPRFLAVSFHADWCASCQALSPKVDAARTKAKLDLTDVLFVKLDLTNDKTSHQAALLARSLGIEELFHQNDGKTGYVDVVEATSGIIISKITKNNNVDEIVHLLDLDK